MGVLCFFVNLLTGTELISGGTVGAGVPNRVAIAACHQPPHAAAINSSFEASLS